MNKNGLNNTGLKISEEIPKQCKDCFCNNMCLFLLRKAGIIAVACIDNANNTTS